ncbi:MAG: Glycosyl transferase family 2 [Firmicutes bacterium ADurb.Bin182]|nr:MAG: Glycosyl transferase family 2 [Firmicutes bacterium ADurb.Bin182]
MGEEKISDRTMKLIATILGIRPRKEKTVMLDEHYDEFLKNTSPDATELYYQRDESAGVLFSVICILKGAADAGSIVASLNDQTCRDWELCIAVDPEPEWNMKPLTANPKIRLCVLPDSEEEELINAAVGMARGDYFLFLNTGDSLTSDALYCFTEQILDWPDADLIYADEDLTGNDDKRICPVFKPEFSPETLLSYNYIGAPLLISRMLYETAGGLKGTDSASAYDYVIRCSEECKAAAHISRVLLSKRNLPASVKPSNGRDILDSVIRSKGYSGYSVTGIWDGSFRVRYGIRKNPKVSIIIPGAERFESLRRTLESIDDYATYKNYEIIISDIKKTDNKLSRYYDALKSNKAAKIILYDSRATPGKLLNMGADKAKGEFLLFLGSEIEIISPEWLESMVELAQRQDIGAVGTKMITPDEKIYHAGIVIGLGGWYGSVYFGSRDETGESRFDSFVNTLRNVTAVSGECMMVSLREFYRAGCFNEIFQTAGWDVDLCLKLAQSGKRNVYTPFANVKSHAKPLNWDQLSDRELRELYDVLSPVLRNGDPYFNPNFDYAKSNPVCAEKPYPAIELNPYGG